ncbi:CRISPR-associated endonuclease Cas2 [Desulfovibrio gilichinskyi]|uniref:CRISPR-associated endoribonuclease Cas2 n=1 Tax=Desulfovibrio gilichinskyi TaxID=1519643 RepID=A0A1X7DCW9_9BACT|nr:CRISPR-associated endonuclease Cas2 [Desulfovibrio gilichinskyi]SMF13094.1 CRISPR-associated protein Cas2 [Desulfovibrio gilichinskyi]
MSKITRHLIAYDISCDKERYKVSKVLEGFGFRVQESVFECDLNTRLKRKLISKLENLEVETGFISIYLVGSHKPKDIGNAPPRFNENYAFVI